MFSFEFLKRKNVRNALSFAIIIGLIVMVIALYKTKLEKFGNSPSVNTAVVTYYYLPNCPYCVAFSDEWTKFEATADPSLMKAVSVDASDDSNKKLVSAEGVSGYPTIRITKNGNTVDYKGERKATALIDYVSNL